MDLRELRYSELKFDGQTYTQQWQIDEILVKNKYSWLVTAEIKNARLEIFQDTLVWNGGIWYNGSWYFGVWRDGEWKSGTWENGVWYNGKWKNGIFKSGIIYNGTFFKGKIEGGEIRGGQFVDVEIGKEVVEYTEDEYSGLKQKEAQQQQGPPPNSETLPVDPNTVKVHTTPIPSQSPEPKIQENNNIKMRKLKDFGSFLKENVGDLEETFVEIDNDESKVKIAQKTGKVLIETPSKTDAYNMKMQYGGESIVDSKFPEKQIQTVKEKK